MIIYYLRYAFSIFIVNNAFVGTVVAPLFGYWLAGRFGKDHIKTRSALQFVQSGTALTILSILGLAGLRRGIYQAICHPLRFASYPGLFFANLLPVKAVQDGFVWSSGPPEFFLVAFVINVTLFFLLGIAIDKLNKHVKSPPLKRTKRLR
jgi:hypothetical protein